MQLVRSRSKCTSYRVELFFWKYWNMLMQSWHTGHLSKLLCLFNDCNNTQRKWLWHSPKCKSSQQSVFGQRLFSLCSWPTQSKQQVFSLSLQIVSMMLAMPCFMFPLACCECYKTESKRALTLASPHVSLTEMREECRAAAWMLRRRIFIKF